MHWKKNLRKRGKNIKTAKALKLAGLARRAGKLVYGDAAVSQAVVEKQVRLICTPQDASEKISARAQRMPDRSNGLYTQIPCSQQELGAALGLETCQIIAFLDPGFSAKFIEELAQEDSSYQGLAQELQGRQERALKRKKKKTRGKPPVLHLHKEDENL